MDAHRFDSLTRIVAAPASRRRALGALFGGGVLGTLGQSARPAMAQGVCSLDFVGTVRVGPTSTQVLTNGSSQPGEVRGVLSFGLDQAGGLESASLALADGTSLPVVGQVTGRSLHFRVAAGAGLTIVGVGVGEQEIAACQGAIDGMLTGPQAGDLGDWHALAAGTAGSTQPAQSTSRVTLAPGTDTTTAPPPVAPTAVPPTTAPPPSGSNCGPGLTDCGSTCVDLSSDMNHCGACGAVCESGLVPVECRSGVCERASCPVGITYCGAVDGCRDTMTDPAHCGGCQQPCADGECVGGVCGGGGGAGGGCDLGMTDCGGVCTDLNDNANCGACGTACGANQTCTGGVCVDNPVDPNACAPGLENCFGTCVDLTNNANNCGGCGIPCPAGQLCQSKVCVAGGPACAPGLTACGGICLNLMTDSFACGACTNVCGEGQSCQGGVCAA